MEGVIFRNNTAEVSFDFIKYVYGRLTYLWIVRNNHDKRVVGKLGDNNRVSTALDLKIRVVCRIPAANHLVVFHVMTF